MSRTIIQVLGETLLTHLMQSTFLGKSQIVRGRIAFCYLNLSQGTSKSVSAKLQQWIIFWSQLFHTVPPPAITVSLCIVTRLQPLLFPRFAPPASLLPQLFPTSSGDQKIKKKA